MTARDDYPELAYQEGRHRDAGWDANPYTQALTEIDELRKLAVIARKVLLDCAVAGNSWWAVIDGEVVRMDPSRVIVKL